MFQLCTVRYSGIPYSFDKFKTFKWQLLSIVKISVAEPFLNKGSVSAPVPYLDYKKHSFKQNFYKKILLNEENFILCLWKLLWFHFITVPVPLRKNFMVLVPHYWLNFLLFDPMLCIGIRSGSDFPSWCRSRFGSGSYLNLYTSWKIKILVL